MDSEGLSSCDHSGQHARGELLVLNGRQSGARRPLDVPVTVIGRAAGCEVRLNVDGVDPFHCILASDPKDVTIRDLGSTRGSFVNGQRISAAVLRDGDLLDIGPFRFRIVLHPISNAASNLSPPERDALRIQAAAVAAQQAALDENEDFLLQSRTTLEQQEAQFTAHFDEQRQRLEETAQQLIQKRLALEHDYAALEAERSEARVHLEVAERRLAQRALAMDGAREQIQELHRDLDAERLQFNTERELDSRLLRDGWRQLEAEQARWRERRQREAVALRVRNIMVLDGERKLAVAREELLRQKEAWETQQCTLATELRGLNTRIAHQRKLLQQQAAEALVAPGVSLEPDVDSTPTEPVPVPLAVANMDRVNAQLADQRADLLEQWQRLVRVEQAWQDRRDVAARELETLVEQLAQQEEKLALRERDADQEQCRLNQWRNQLDTQRQEMVANQVRIQTERQLWEHERDQLQADARRAGEIARYQLDRLSDLRKTWNRKRQNEIATLRVERRATHRLGRNLTEAREAVARTAQNLQDGEHDENAVLRALTHQRAALKKDLASLHQLQAELAKNIEALAEAQARLQDREISLDEREAVLAANQAHLDGQLERGEALEQFNERRLTLLQDESDQLARALIPNGDPPAHPLDRAA